MEEQEFTRKSQKLLTEALKAGDDPRKMGELQKSHVASVGRETKIFLRKLKV